MIVNKKTIFIIFILNFIFLYLVYFYFNNYYKNNYFVQEVRETWNYKFINPILECNTNFKFYNTNNIEKKISDFINTNKNKFNTISYYFRALNNGSTFWSNEDVQFVPASLLKIPIAMAYFKVNEENKLDLMNTKILVDKLNFKVQERDFGKDNINIWNTYSLYDFIEKMLTHSDNTAATILFYNLWNDFFKKIYLELWLDFLDLESNNIKISVKKYSTFFRILYNSSYLNRTNSELMLKMLSESDFNIWLKALLPKDIVVANKYWERYDEGIWEKQLHDCGIIYYPNNPYILCVMTKWNNFDDLTYMIKNISKIVFDDVASK